MRETLTPYQEMSLSLQIKRIYHLSSFPVLEMQGAMFACWFPNYHTLARPELEQSDCLRHPLKSFGT